MKKNTSITVSFVAWDTILNTGKTGLTNITLRGVGDGVEFTPSGSVSEVDATNLPGVYKVTLTAGENNYGSVLIGGKSATANISIIPISWINESEDFSATEKASITAAVPSVLSIQSGLALDNTVAKESTLSAVGLAVTGIANKTVNLPSDPASQSEVETAIEAIPSGSGVTLAQLKKELLISKNS